VSSTFQINSLHYNNDDNHYISSYVVRNVRKNAYDTMMKEVNFASARGINDNRLVLRTSGFIIANVPITFVFLARVSQLL